MLRSSNAPKTFGVFQDLRTEEAQQKRRGVESTSEGLRRYFMPMPACARLPPSPVTDNFRIARGALMVLSP